MEVLIGKPSINGPFSMAMLNNQRVHDLTFIAEKLPRSPASKFNSSAADRTSIRDVLRGWQIYIYRTCISYRNAQTVYFIG